MPIVKTPNDLGQIIRARRKELGWDQARLAKQIGVSRQWIIDIEKGKPRAEFGLLLRTIYALGLSLHLYQGKPEAKQLTSAQPGVPKHSPPTRVDIDRVVDQSIGTLTQDSMAELAKQMSTGIPDDLQKLMRDQNSFAELAKQMPTGIPDDLQKLMRKGKKPPSPRGKTD